MQGGPSGEAAGGLEDMGCGGHLPPCPTASLPFVALPQVPAPRAILQGCSREPACDGERRDRKLKCAKGRAGYVGEQSGPGGDCG